MIPAIDPSNSRFLADLAMISQRQQRAQNQISSGLKITKPSDSPGQVTQLLNAQAEVDRVTQIGTNLSSIKSEVDTAEGALENAANILDQASQLGAEGASSTQTADARANLATQVETLQQQLVGVSATSFGGRYLFSGDQDQAAPYTLDLTQPNGVASNIDWSVTGATRQVLHPSGTTFAISKTAREIFDQTNADGTPAAGNAFAALNNLRTALQNNDSNGINSAVADLQQTSSHLNDELAFYGNAQDQVSAAVDAVNNAEVTDKTALSNIEDADLPTAILEMTQAQTAQQAALTARGQMPRTSLFDYLG